jgi:multiple sugar transport system ATP-binding protein
MAQIKLTNVQKTYNNTVEVLRNINLELESGEFTVFVGPSGCGKSTLLRMIAGLESITAGTLEINGMVMNDVPPAQRGIAMVFQSYALYPHMTVAENMAFALKIARKSSSEVAEAIRHAGEILQLTPLLDRLPKELSGGQRQRVAIGRAIVRNPSVFLFDEPLSNLDAALRVQTRLEIANLHDSMSASMIYVTHDQVEAMTLADKIVLLNAGEAVQREGSIAQVGPPLELYHRPATRFVAGFIGSPKMNFIPGELLSADGEQAKVRLTNGGVVHAAVDARSAKPGDKIELGIRPEHFSTAATEGDVLEGTVSYVERLGEASYLYLKVEGHSELITVRNEGDTPFNPGEKVALNLPTRNCHLFNSDNKALPRLLS